MRMGQLGFAFLKPGDTSWLNNSTTISSISDTDDNIEPPQTDYDIYDEISEIKIN